MPFSVMNVKERCLTEDGQAVAPILKALALSDLTGDFQKILQQFDPRFGQEAFWMELNSMDRIFAMLQSHNFACMSWKFCPRGDFQVRAER